MARGLELQAHVRRFRAQVTRFERERASLNDWRHLHYEAVAAYVSAQREYISLQSQSLASLRAGAPVPGRRRRETLEVLEDLNALHQLMQVMFRHLNDS